MINKSLTLFLSFIFVFQSAVAGIGNIPTGQKELLDKLVEQAGLEFIQNEDGTRTVVVDDEHSVFTVYHNVFSVEDTSSGAVVVIDFYETFGDNFPIASYELVLDESMSAEQVMEAHSTSYDRTLAILDDGKDSIRTNFSPGQIVAVAVAAYIAEMVFIRSGRVKVHKYVKTIIGIAIVGLLLYAGYVWKHDKLDRSVEKARKNKQLNN